MSNRDYTVGYAPSRSLEEEAQELVLERQIRLLLFVRHVEERNHLKLQDIDQAVVL